MTTILTIGHGTLAAEAFTALVTGAEIGEVVDVRSFPGSRRNPQFGSDAMAGWLPESGVSYTWMRALGGRRPPVPGSKHLALRNPSFRAYADHMETDAFLAGVDDLLDRSGRAVMCSETVWWRCHRRLLADHLVLVRDIGVHHLMHDGRLTLHAPTEGVRLVGDRLVYDVGVTPPLPELA
ncbi:MAG: repair protein [Ilumatobacteraceae bacterium]|nr:repair protein [Ilumatobacteraceae bacterium]